MFKEMLESFERLSEGLDNPISEILVSHSKIDLVLENRSTISRNDFNIIDSYDKSLSISEIDVFEDELHVLFHDVDAVFDGEKKNKKDKDIFTVYSFILKLREIMCTCPILQFAISSTYVKVFLDVPDVTAHKIVGVDDLLQQEGSLVFAINRPYVLYVKDW